MALNDNERFQEFVKQLAAKGVTICWAWETRRDWTTNSGHGRKADVGMIFFTGSGFQPSHLTAIVTDYGKRDGFGLYLDAPGASLSADVDAIAKPAREPKAAMPDVEASPVGEAYRRASAEH